MNSLTDYEKTFENLNSAQKEVQERIGRITNDPKASKIRDLIERSKAQSTKDTFFDLLYANDLLNEARDLASSLKGSIPRLLTPAPGVGHSPSVVAGSEEMRSEKLGEWRDPETGMAFVNVPGGCFQMGSPNFEKGRSSDEGPVQKVCVEGFWLGKHEVTNGEYRKFKTGHDSGKYEGHSLNGDDQPVVSVSWNEATAYAEWLSGRGNGRFRLPTEEEWEYAARGGTTTARYWGDGEKEACQYANVADPTAKKERANWTTFDCTKEDGFVVTAPVGRFKANGFGLHDMLGNVWEWTCSSWGSYREKWYKNCANKGSYRVGRGGGWDNGPANVRSAGRYGGGPGYRSGGLGFRLLRRH